MTKSETTAKQHRTGTLVSIPPARVETALLARLKKVARVEKRSLSDVIRCAIRDGLDYRHHMTAIEKGTSE